MKRSHSASESNVIRPFGLTSSDCTQPEKAEAPAQTDVPALAGQPALVDPPMAFPGPFAYAPKPQAMDDELSQDDLATARPATPPGPNKGELAATSSEASVAKEASAPNLKPTTETEKPPELPPLLLAASTGELASLEVLLQEPALDIDQRDHNEYTALHWAVESRSIDLVKRLLKAGANANLAANHRRLSPLMRAATVGDVASLKALLAHEGINVD